jgi:hypothetical protein
MGTVVFVGAFQIVLALQMFVLGPRLILSIRKYQIELAAGSDADTSMASIVFQGHVHIRTSSTV